SFRCRCSRALALFSAASRFALAASFSSACLRPSASLPQKPTSTAALTAAPQSAAETTSTGVLRRASRRNEMRRRRPPGHASPRRRTTMPDSFASEARPPCVAPRVVCLARVRATLLGVHRIIDAAGTFFHHLADVHWLPLAVALGFQLLRLLARVPAWRAIIRASYPETTVPRRTILGAYLAGVGVNAIVPARGGDVLKLYLVKHRVEEVTYPTLGATLIVETLFDMVVAGGILIWALTIGVLPSLDVLPDLPQVDWSWPLRHKREALVIGLVWLAVLVLLSVIGIRRARAFKQRVRQGFAILGDRPRFVRDVVTWQSLSWVFRIASVYFFLEAFRVPATLHNALLVLVVQSLST